MDAQNFPVSEEDTIFALSSGALPAAIAIMRVSGPKAANVFSLLRTNCPKSRHPALRRLCDPVDGGLIDEALCLYFAGDNTATGEELVELHCHGSRAVVSRLSDIFRHNGLREAEPGEFTRRAFANGRMDLNQADGLAELIEAEDERARKLAAAMYSGAFSHKLDLWRETLLSLSAEIETQLDFADEDDVPESALDVLLQRIEVLRAEVKDALRAPLAERIGHGVRVLIAGPPNSGKSTLLNALAGRDAAIVSDIEGTTRDLIEVPLRIGGQAFLLIDSAGLREAAGDDIEAIGMERALAMANIADMILWLGPEGEGPQHARRIEIAAKADRPDRLPKSENALSLSAATGEGLAKLKEYLLRASAEILHSEDEFALNRRQQTALVELNGILRRARQCQDWILIGEDMRLARATIDRLTGRAATEDMLDTLFGRFCIGK